ncbi:MAG: aldo/keto reductase [Aggregatilineales bacterium]
MIYAQLGRAGVQVSRIGLGTVNFGPITSESDSCAIMDAALDLGINFLDTADIYGRQAGEGITEQIIGRWLAIGGGRREKVFLATKVYHQMGNWPNQGGLSALHIRHACEASLRRLQTDHIDLYQMHHIDRSTPWEEIWEAMERLVQAGKILYVGSSNFAAWHIVQAQHAARERHFMGLVSEQSHYNLTARTIELEVIPACQSYGMALFPWGPQSEGLLAGALSGSSFGRRSESRVQSRLEQLRPKVGQYEALCAGLGQHPAHVALAWLLKNPVVTAPIIGPRTVEQLRDSLKALEIELSDETLHILDEIWPGPGGPAPEAYAW